jgi:hypothetical protein
MITQCIHSLPPHVEGGSFIGNFRMSYINEKDPHKLQVKGVKILKYEWTTFVDSSALYAFGILLANSQIF